jgi:creatinine amidohydrolase/Fe(II)-dependent formamide hydrolase-like protein
MHKSITKINKAAIIIIYHHGTNFVTLPMVKNLVVTLFMMKIETKTHAENKLSRMLKFK